RVRVSLAGRTCPGGPVRGGVLSSPRRGLCGRVSVGPPYPSPSRLLAFNLAAAHRFYRACLVDCRQSTGYLPTPRSSTPESTESEDVVWRTGATGPPSSSGWT